MYNTFVKSLIWGTFMQKEIFSFFWSCAVPCQTFAVCSLRPPCCSLSWNIWQMCSRAVQPCGSSWWRSQHGASTQLKLYGAMKNSGLVLRSCFSLKLLYLVCWQAMLLCSGLNLIFPHLKWVVCGLVRAEFEQNQPYYVLFNWCLNIQARRSTFPDVFVLAVCCVSTDCSLPVSHIWQRYLLADC